MKVSWEPWHSDVESNGPSQDEINVERKDMMQEKEKNKSKKEIWTRVQTLVSASLALYTQAPKEPNTPPVAIYIAVTV